MDLSDIFILLAGITIGAGVVYFLLNSGQTKQVSLTNNLISNDEAFNMIARFQNSNEGVDVVSGHIPIDILLGYLGYINEAAAGKQAVSGLEIYFAKYGDINKVNNANSELMALPNQQTFVIFPTYLNANGMHKPFDPIQSTNINTVEIEELRANHDPNQIQQAPPANFIALNRGNMVPPRWN